jgi:hypothetical protein
MPVMNHDGHSPLPSHSSRIYVSRTRRGPKTCRVVGPLGGVRIRGGFAAKGLVLVEQECEAWWSNSAPPGSYIGAEVYAQFLFVLQCGSPPAQSEARGSPLCRRFRRCGLVAMGAPPGFGCHQLEPFWLAVAFHTPASICMICTSDP